MRLGAQANAPDEKAEGGGAEFVGDGGGYDSDSTSEGGAWAHWVFAVWYSVLGAAAARQQIMNIGIIWLF